jgi:hypothetical protein
MPTASDDIVFQDHAAFEHRHSSRHSLRGLNTYRSRAHVLTTDQRLNADRK